MDSQSTGKNDPCPCASGKRFRQCCWLKRLQTAGPATVANATRFGSARVGYDSFGYVPPGPYRSPLSPDLVVKVFLPERREWVDSRLADLTRGQEFIAHDRLYHVVGPEAYAHLVKVDVAKIPEADRPYDPRNWRPPESRDVVYAYDHDGTPLGHRLLANLDPGQRCVFQGLKYHIEPGPTPNTGTLIGDGEVDHPAAARLFVWLEYTIHDALGTATVGYRYPQGRLIPLADGTVAAVEDLTPGAVFRLEQEGVATVATVGRPKPWTPTADCKDASGNTVRNVVGTFQFTG